MAADIIAVDSMAEVTPGISAIYCISVMANWKPRPLCLPSISVTTSSPGSPTATRKIGTRRSLPFWAGRRRHRSTPPTPPTFMRTAWRTTSSASAPGLRALLHPGAADVEAFLAQDIVTLDELKQIYVAVYFMPPQTVLRAIADAFRTAEDAYDVVLGRWIYNDAGDGEICLSAWDLFEDVRHCALQVSPALDDWAQVEQLATLSLRFLSWQLANTAELSRADMLFHLTGVFVEHKWERRTLRPQFSHKLGMWCKQTAQPGCISSFHSQIRIRTTSFCMASMASATFSSCFSERQRSRTPRAHSF
ncbi:hypothetical protein DFH09DRAFT_1276049, partial [Mycena vulgaris]